MHVALEPRTLGVSPFFPRGKIGMSRALGQTAGDRLLADLEAQSLPVVNWSWRRTEALQSNGDRPWYPPWPFPPAGKGELQALQKLTRLKNAQRCLESYIGQGDH